MSLSAAVNGRLPTYSLVPILGLPAASSKDAVVGFRPSTRSNGSDTRASALRPGRVILSLLYERMPTGTCAHSRRSPDECQCATGTGPERRAGQARGSAAHEEE